MTCSCSYVCTFIDTIRHGQGQHSPPPLFSLPPLYDALVRDSIVTQPDIKYLLFKQFIVENMATTQTPQNFLLQFSLHAVLQAKTDNLLFSQMIFILDKKMWKKFKACFFRINSWLVSVFLIDWQRIILLFRGPQFVLLMQITILSG